MSRLRFEIIPEDFSKARRALDEAFRSLREVLDRGFRAREQFPCVLDTVIDAGELPTTYSVPGITQAPTAVLLLRATAQGGASGQFVSGGSVTWEWRGGRLLLVDVDALASGRWDATLAVVE